MKNSFFSKFAKLSLALLFVSCIAFVACKPEPEIDNPKSAPIEIAENDGIIGVWSCTYDSGYVETYTITATTFDAGSYSYAGNELKVIKTSDDSGYIYFKFTRAAKADWTYSEDPKEAPDVGKWYAVSYKNLKADSISLSGAYKSGGKTSTDTIDEAIKEFTIGNGYFGTYSELKKQ